MAFVVLNMSNNKSSGVEAKKALKKFFKINDKQVHEYLGHLSKDTTRMTAKYLGMILSCGLVNVKCYSINYPISLRVWADKFLSFFSVNQQSNRARLI
jgi:hypothetical protein